MEEERPSKSLLPSELSRLKDWMYLHIFDLPILGVYRTIWAPHWAVIPNAVNTADELHMLSNEALQDESKMAWH